MQLLLYTLTFTMFTLFNIVESVVEQHTTEISPSTLRTGDLILTSKCPIVRTLQMDPFSHSAVCVLNRKNVAYIFDIMPNSYPSMAKLTSDNTQLYVRRLNKPLPLKSVLQYVSLVKHRHYTHSYFKAAFEVPLRAHDMFCCSLVSGLYIFTGAMSSSAGGFLPKDFCRDSSQLPMKKPYRFGPIQKLSNDPLH